MYLYGGSVPWMMDTLKTDSFMRIFESEKIQSG